MYFEIAANEPDIEEEILREAESNGNFDYQLEQENMTYVLGSLEYDTYENYEGDLIILNSFLFKIEIRRRH